MSTTTENRARVKQVIDILVQKTKNQTLRELIISLSNKLNNKCN